MSVRGLPIRTAGALLACLLVAPALAQDATALDARLDALEQRFEDGRQAAEEIREARRGETDAEIASVRREIEAKVFTANVLFGLLAAFVALVGVALTLLGYRRIAEQAEKQASRIVEERLTSARIEALVRAQSQPMIDDLRADLERRTADVEARIDQDARERIGGVESDAQERVRRLMASLKQQADELASAPAAQDERSRGKAEALGRALESLDPDRSDWESWRWILEGQRASSEEDYEAALAAFDQAMSLEADSAHFWRGYALNELGRHDEALAALDRALDLDPDNATAHNNRGYALSELGRYDEALAAYDRALDLDPDLATVHHNRGDVLNALGRHDEALAAYDLALDLDPDLATVHNNRGNVLNELGLYEDALAALGRALGLDPNYAPAHHNRGSVLNGLGRYDEALAALDRALDLESDAVTHVYRGRVLANLGRYEEALAALDRALDLDPDHPSVWYLKARVHLYLERPANAERDAAEALGRCPSQPDASYRSAVSLYLLAVAQRLQGKDAAEAERSLGQHLTEPFPKRLGWVAFDAPLTDDAEIQAEIDALSERLRAHDAAHAPAGDRPPPAAGDGAAA